VIRVPTRPWGRAEVTLSGSRVGSGELRSGLRHELRRFRSLQATGIDSIGERARIVAGVGRVLGRGH